MEWFHGSEDGNLKLLRSKKRRTITMLRYAAALNDLHRIDVASFARARFTVNFRQSEKFLGLVIEVNVIGDKAN